MLSFSKIYKDMSKKQTPENLKIGHFGQEFWYSSSLQDWAIYLQAMSLETGLQIGGLGARQQKCNF